VLYTIRMANFEDITMLFAINNVEEHENHNIYYERQIRNPDNVTSFYIVMFAYF
jgi:hypothetical protein